MITRRPRRVLLRAYHLAFLAADTVHDAADVVELVHELLLQCHPLFHVLRDGGVPYNARKHSKHYQDHYGRSERHIALTANSWLGMHLDADPQLQRHEANATHIAEHNVVTCLHNMNRKLDRDLLLR